MKELYKYVFGYMCLYKATLKSLKTSFEALNGYRNAVEQLRN